MRNCAHDHEIVKISELQNSQVRSVDESVTASTVSIFEIDTFASEKLSEGRQ